MKNVASNELVTCIMKDFDDFKSIIEEITDGILTCEYDLDGISTTETEYAEENEICWDGNILEKLSEYFGVEVTSYHADNDEYLSVWICYKISDAQDIFEMTKNRIKNGFEKGIISIVDSDGTYGCLGVCCRIGQTEFYFLSSEDEGISLEKYWKQYTVDDTIDTLYECLKDEKSAKAMGISEDDFNYYRILLPLD